MLYTADFHIHSCLSPCASLEMSPSDIVSRARKSGLNLVAISDHNCTRNAQALHDVCRRYDDIDCVYGIEVTSVEEVHNLCLFEDLKAASDFGEFVYDSLQKIPHNPNRFGDQIVVDADDYIIDEIENYLGSASIYSIERLLQETHQRGGLFVPAHVDRAIFSMSSQLGFIPPDVYDAIEYSRHYYAAIQQKETVTPVVNAEMYPAITNSDAHYLANIGETGIDVELPSLSINHLANAFLRGAYSATSKSH